MKVPLIAALVLAALVPSVFSEGIIARGGMNLAGAFTDPKPVAPMDPERLTGFNAALLGEFGNGPVCLLVGAGYENKGMHVAGTGGGDFRLDYVTVPVLASFRTDGGDFGASFFLNLGVEPAYLLSSDTPAGGFALDAQDFDFSLRSEIGVELPITYSGPAALLGLGYTYAFTDANFGGGTWHNYAFHAYAGLKIRTL